MKVNTILDQIDMGSIALPEFQRGYVWSRRQVRSFMTSLYKRHPGGSLLVWETRTEDADARGGQDLSTGTVKLLLDGPLRCSHVQLVLDVREGDRASPPDDVQKFALKFAQIVLDAEVTSTQGCSLDDSIAIGDSLRGWVVRSDHLDIVTGNRYHV